nr:ribonuclease H-like domain-containing protein [Tanacetum cinerariifolium]
MKHSGLENQLKTFFLAIKDETSPILKTFITGLENQLSLKVKVIRSDNGYEFKNSDLNQLCGMIGIKREFSVPRTPQQNGIAKRKNRTLIEATRTMLADSLLPIPFWTETVNAACYVQNRVLVTKPLKTLYELLLARTPSIGFMRPFGCPVTILNTLDSLEKFEEKNYDGDGAFDEKEHDFDAKKHESEVILFPSSSAQLRKQDDKTKKEAKGKSHVKSFTGYRDLSAEFEDCSNNSSNEVNAAGTIAPTIGQNSSNNTNPFSAAGLSNTTASPTHGKSSYIDAFQLSDDPDMPELEDITYSDDENNVGAEANFNNLETSITEEPKRVHQALKDPSWIEAIQEELLQFKMQNVKQKKDAIFISQDKYVAKILRKFGLTKGKLASTPIDTEKPLLKDPDGEDADVHTYRDYLEDITYSDDENDAGAEADFNNLETSITVSPILTTRVHKDHHVSQIIGDLSLTTQTKGMTRVFKDQGGLSQMFDDDFHTCIIIKNKARLVTQGHTQEEGIDYKEVFALVARIEAIRLYLAYTSFMGFMVYQMDVKSVFLYGTIKEEVYACQPPRFEDPDHPDKGYKVVKALYGLHQDPRASLTKGKSASTLIDTEKPLLKDPVGEDVDVHTYRLMIGSLMYLTSSRPDIMFAVVLSGMESLKRMLHVSYILSVGYLTTTTNGSQFTMSNPYKNWLVHIKRSLVNDVTRLQALFDKKEVVVTDDAIREVLWLDDAEGVDCLPNEEIFIELARMGYEKPSTKLTFYKAFFSSQWKFLIHTILLSMSTKRTSWNEFSSAMASAVNCLSTCRKFNFSKYIFDSLVRNVDSTTKFYMYPCFLKLLIRKQVEHLEYDKVAQALKITKLKRRVKKLEKGNKARVLKLRRLQKVGTSQRVDTSDDTVMDDESNQGRMIDDMDKDDVVVLMDENKEDKKVKEAKEDGPTKVQDVVDVVTTAKLITEVVTAASETVITASAIISVAEP